MLFDDEYTGATFIRSAVFGKSRMCITKRYQQNHMNTSWGHIWFMISLGCKTNISYCFHNDVRQRWKHIFCSLLMRVELEGEVKLEPNFGTEEHWNRQDFPDREKSGADVERYKLTFLLGESKDGEQRDWLSRSRIFVYEFRGDEFIMVELTQSRWPLSLEYFKITFRA